MNDNRADLLTTKLGIDSHGLIDAGTAMDHLYLLPETVVSQMRTNSGIMTRQLTKSQSFSL